jgi:hypothetical protein
MWQCTISKSGFVGPKWQKNIQYCSLAGLGRTTTLRAQGWRGFNDITGSGASWGWQHHGLGEDDGAMGPGTAWVNIVVRSGMELSAQRHGLGEDNVVVGSGTASWAWGQRLCGQRRHWLESGKMAVHKGAWPWLRTTTQRLWGGLDNGAEALGRTQRWHELRGGQRRRGVQGNFWWESLVAWRREWKPPRFRVCKGHAIVYL